MESVLKEIHVTNFKSLKDVKVVFNNFNVIVGRNGSGKTNFIELFKFLKNVLVEEKRPYMPYADWWSYDNIVWKRKAELPIKVGLRMKVHGHSFFYEFVFGTIGGTSRIIEEKLTIDEIVSIKREGSSLRVEHDKKFLEKYAKKIEHLLQKKKEKIKVEYLLEHITNLPPDFSNLLHLFRHGHSFSAELKYGLCLTVLEPIYTEGNRLVFVFPVKKNVRATIKNEEIRKSIEIGFPFAFILFEEFGTAIEHFTILRHPNIKEIKSPTMPRKEEVLSEDSSNLHNVLYYWFLEKNGKLPERIEKALSTLFPHIQVRPSLTSEGKVFLQMFEAGVELAPPCMPDGLYKLLAILSAIELKPALLAIDEIENSLHAELLEYILDELRNSGVTVIVTTHSPLVVDMVKLEELLVSEMTADGTVLRRVKDPKEVREKLRKLKITQSESWIYGALPVD